MWGQDCGGFVLALAASLGPGTQNDLGSNSLGPEEVGGPWAYDPVSEDYSLSWQV